jgi:hypothetical protein
MSELRVDIISDLAGTGDALLTNQQGAKAICVADTNAVTITSSFNVTSITDNATGDYTYTITNALSAAGQACMNASSSYDATYEGWRSSIFTDGSAGARVAPTASVFLLNTVNNTLADADSLDVCWTMHGTLA